MTQSPAKQTLQSRVLKTEPVNWRELSFLQHDQFKDLGDDAKRRLKASIISNNFTQPFYVWQDPSSGVIYCLDGKHRTLMLEELTSEGHEIPYLLPATFIHCESKTDAARLVLIYSSIYAKITQQGLFDFIEAFDLNYTHLRDQVDLPEFSMDRFEQKFDMYHVKDDQDEYEVEIDPDEEIIVKPGDMFQLGSHRIVCSSFSDLKKLAALMEGAKARIMISDPPYNIPMGLFVKDRKKHQDFAMGIGEMSDEEFVEFLGLIMKRAKENTVKGAIHYIFMDWRHVWHMTEAGRRVYGSTIPKQMCVWNKDLMANGSFYRPKHELCFVFNSQSARNLWNKDMLDRGGNYKDNDELCFIFKNGDEAKHLSHLDMKDRIRTNVWNYPSASSMKNPDRYELKDHPTPKPVAMIADAILDTTNPGEGVIDFFLGSGTCLIAAEKTGRRCYGVEIEPHHIQHCVKRYLTYCLKNGCDVNFRHLNGDLTINHFTHDPEPSN